MDSSLRRWWLNSSFDRSSVWDPSSIRESSFKCTFTLLIFRPQTPSLSLPLSLLQKVLLTWGKWKSVISRGILQISSSMAAPISAAVLHPLPPPTECHKVQVLFSTTKKSRQQSLPKSGHSIYGLKQLSKGWSILHSWKIMCNWRTKILVSQKVLY